MLENLRQELNNINGRRHHKQVLEAQQNRKNKPAHQVSPLLQIRKGHQQEPQQKPIVLEIHMVHNHKH